jgi:predicted Ser/Thr protein kinase
MTDHIKIPTTIAAMADDLLRWIESSLASGNNILATSNQGTVLLFEGEGLKLVIKSAMGRGAVRKARQATLQREYSAYRRLQGVAGVPACHGMLAQRFLLMDFIDGVPYREASWQDRDQWFAALLKIIRAFHARGVSHGDLKSKSNLIAGRDGQPYVIDFGTTFVYKDGFHPINNYFFQYGKRLDINAWVKHKYHGRYKDASEEDMKLLNYSKLEYVIRRVRGRPMH